MKLLLAEDDALLADALSAQLGGAGYQVDHAPNGAVADYLLQRTAYDIVVLDVGLPMLEGLSVLTQLRTRQPDLPVLLLSARDALDDRVAGLQAGADDYVTKPFDLPELLARLQALLRRRQPKAAVGQVELWGDLKVELDKHRATVKGTALELSGREWSLLLLLLEHREKVVGKDVIMQAWASEGGEPGAGNMIEVYIHRLRRKLDGSGLSIRTVRGLGYLMEPLND